MVTGPLHDSSGTARWLGSGIYFFEENVEAAIRWAMERATRGSDDPAVVTANIDITNCLDLTRPTFQSITRSAFMYLQSEWVRDATLVPKDQMPFEVYMGLVRAGYRGEWQDYGRNELDFRVIEKAIELARDQHKMPLDTVRGAFLEGAPLYTNSWFFEGAHVAIAVRDPFSSISDLAYFALS
jgi:hypothetical protein